MLIELLRKERNKRAIARTCWDSAVEEVWKDIGGSQVYITCAEKLGRYKRSTNRKDRKKGERG